MNVSMNPNYIEDLNGSDYVCMTRSTPQSVSKLASLNAVPVAQRESPNNMPVPATAMQLTSKNLQTLQQEQMNANRSQLSESERTHSISPTPSQLSNNSNKRKLHIW